MPVKNNVMDGYIRVSQVGGRSGERFQSPTQQRTAIKGWAKAHAVKIAAWHEDLDRSGGTMDRPGMNEALERVRAGKTSGVVVARLDRFARTVVGGLTTIQQLSEQGARVVSVAEQIDPATPMGRAMLGLLLIMAEWQRDQANEYIAVALDRAVSAGRFPGKTPFGYQRDEKGHTLVNPDTATVVHRIFAERAAGVGWRKIADGLIADGIPTSLGKERWAPSAIQGIIHSEAPLGVFCGPRGLRVEDAWPAIVTRDLWERANSVRGTRDDARRYEDRLFAGLARCANCRNVLSRTKNPEGFISYACRTIGCKARPSLGAVLLDTHLSAIVDERLARIVVEPQPADDGGEAARLVAARDTARRELEAWRDDTGLRGVLGDHDWREGMLARARARDDAEVALAEHRARGGLLNAADLPGGVVPRLEELPWPVRRRVVEALVHSVWLRPSEHHGPRARQHVADRFRLVWRDDSDRPGFPSRNGGALPPLVW